MPVLRLVASAATREPPGRADTEDPGGTAPRLDMSPSLSREIKGVTVGGTPIRDDWPIRRRYWRKGITPRPVKIVVGFGPGSAADLTARVRGAAAVENHGPAVHRREQARRRQHGGGGPGRARPERRLHAVHGDGRECHQRGDAAQSQFRFRQGLCPCCLHHIVAEYFGGASLDRRQQCQGVDRAVEGKARTGVLRFVRRRHLAASVGRIVQHDGRHQDGACAVFRQRAGGHRSARGPHPGDVFSGLDRAAICGSGTAQSAGVFGTDARVGGSRSADRGRGRAARIRHQRLVRRRGPDRYFARDHRKTLCRDRRCVEKRRGDKAAAHGGTRHQGRNARRFRGVYRHRNQEVDRRRDIGGSSQPIL